jgi:hypothetical protein
MIGNCALKGICFAPEVSCSNGEGRLEDCNHWNAGHAESILSVDASIDASDATSVKFPWTGNALGATDLGFLAGSLTTRLLAIVGLADAGKTSLLAAFYLLLGRGINAEGVSFSGSLTLEGWENIASNLRWTSPNGPSFPAHTSSGGGRRPGLLHLSLTLPARNCELLAADAPGEWFSSWAINRDINIAEGARWLAAYADVVLVVADCQALAGAQRGLARKGLTDLLRRVGAEVQDRPVALVWTKCDVSVPTDIEQVVREAAARSLGTHSDFRVSMHPAKGVIEQDRGQGILELLSWIVTVSLGKNLVPTVENPERELLQSFGKL